MEMKPTPKQSARNAFVLFIMFAIFLSVFSTGESVFASTVGFVIGMAVGSFASNIEEHTK